MSYRIERYYTTKLFSTDAQYLVAIYQNSSIWFYVIYARAL